MTVGMQTTVASCPACGRTINLESQLRQGQEIMCLNCGIGLGIISLEPLEFDWSADEFEKGWWSEEVGVGC